MFLKGLGTFFANKRSPKSYFFESMRSTIMTEIDHSIWKSESVAAHYLERKDSRPFIREQIEVMLKLIKSLCRPVNRFMDLGCGDGILSAVLLENFPQSTAVLVDHSAPMLDAAKENLDKVIGSVRFCAADYSSPEWIEAAVEYAPYDLMVSGFSIHHQPDIRKREIYAEIYDILMPGGMFINLEHVASPTTRTAKLWDDIRIDALYDFALRGGSSKTRDVIEKEYLKRPERKANLFTSVETQCEWLRDIGFADVDCFFKYFELAIFGGCKPERNSGVL
jgi:tRNA (cmo5U34)-methyltransferase